MSIEELYQTWENFRDLRDRFPNSFSKKDAGFLTVRDRERLLITIFKRVKG